MQPAVNTAFNKAHDEACVKATMAWQKCDRATAEAAVKKHSDTTLESFRLLSEGQTRTAIKNGHAKDAGPGLTQILDVDAYFSSEPDFTPAEEAHYDSLDLLDMPWGDLSITDYM